MLIERTQQQIDEVVAKCVSEPRKFPGMSYAEGVQAALDWVTGMTDIDPMED